jgi:hypothetical protein
VFIFRGPKISGLPSPQKQYLKIKSRFILQLIWQLKDKEIFCYLATKPRRGRREPPAAFSYCNSHNCSYCPSITQTAFWDNVILSVESQPTFQRKILPRFSGLNNRPSSACYLLHSGFLLGSFFTPEDGDVMFLRKSTDSQRTTR